MCLVTELKIYKVKTEGIQRSSKSTNVTEDFNTLNN